MSTLQTPQVMHSHSAAVTEHFARRMGCPGNTSIMVLLLTELHTYSASLGLQVDLPWTLLNSHHDLMIKPYMDRITAYFRTRYRWDQSLIEELLCHFIVGRDVGQPINLHETKIQDYSGRDKKTDDMLASALTLATPDPDLTPAPTPTAAQSTTPQTSGQTIAAFPKPTYVEPPVILGALKPHPTIEIMFTFRGNTAFVLDPHDNYDVFRELVGGSTKGLVYSKDMVSWTRLESRDAYVSLWLGVQRGQNEITLRRMKPHVYYPDIELGGRMRGMRRVHYDQ